LSNSESLTVIAGVGDYLASLKKKDSTVEQQQLFRLARWFGNDRLVSVLGPQDVGDYGDHVVGAGSAENTVSHLQNVRKFLAYLHKNGFTQQNLAQHLRAKKARGRKNSDVAGSLGLTELTRDGHLQLAEELQSLKDQRAPIAAAIAKAAADKDVRENAPLEAAREQLGLVESRVRVIENTLRHSVIVDSSKKGGKVVALGSKVRVKDLSTGKEAVYTLVSATEAKPLDGRISNVSPVGKALIKRSAGQEVDVDTPRGKLRYRVVRVTS
tara:strand:+ start:1439 stop:2245 length:807 start_codon:yes stop_codon:yes gene_type:complete